METNPDFNKYMDRYFNYLGQWESPSKCGLKIIKRKDGKTLAIATEIYRQNPGTPVTEWCAQLATRIMQELFSLSIPLIWAVNLHFTGKPSI
jgi:hypothetical protein